MTENPTYFTLKDGTKTAVKRVAYNKYDFELKLSNGNRKTFVWNIDMPELFINGNNKTDNLVSEAITTFQNRLQHF